MSFDRIPERAAGRRSARLVAGAAAASLTLGFALRALAEDRAGGATITILQASGSSGRATAMGGAAYAAPAGQRLAPSGTLATVAERRRVELTRGKSVVRLRGMPAQLDPTTVQFRSQTDPAHTTVLEQSFRNDLASPDSLLDRSIGRDVALVTAGGEVRGKLLSYDRQHLVLDTGDESYPLRLVRRGENLHDIRVARGAGEVATEPTLEWNIRAERAGAHDVVVSYQTRGMSWGADYSAVIDSARGTIDLTGWVTVVNRSGADYPAAQVTLAANPEPIPVPAFPGQSPAAAEAPRSRSLALESAVDLPDGRAVQLEIFPALSGAKSQEVLLYEPLPNVQYYSSGYPNSDCSAYLYQPVKQWSERHAEIAQPIAGGKRSDALPEGAVRIYRRTSSGALELIGEEILQPATGTLRLRLGISEDIKGERRQLSCTPDPSGRGLTEQIEVKLTNAGGRAAQVIVREYMQRWTNWTVQRESQRGSRATAQAHEYRMNVPASGSKTVTYTVQYVW